MALNSPKFNKVSTNLSLASGSNPTTPNQTLFNNRPETVNIAVGQLGLNKSVTELRKRAWVHGRVNATENVKAKESVTVSAQFACPLPTTESILRMSEIIRAELTRAVSNKVVLVPDTDTDTDTEEKKKGPEMLHAQLVRASASAFVAPKTNVVSSATATATASTSNSKPTSFEIMTAHLKTHRFLNSGHDQPDLFNHVTHAVVVENQNDSKYDGRTHSYPYKKHGPYTCPKCNHVFNTSQKFAAHVSASHYKYETSSERKKRVMAKVSGRTKNLRLQMLKEGLTIAHHHFVADDAGNNNSMRNVNINVAPPPPPSPPPPFMVKVESVQVGEGVRGVKYALAPPPGMEFNPDAGVKIKLETADTI